MQINRHEEHEKGHEPEQQQLKQPQHAEQTFSNPSYLRVETPVTGSEQPERGHMLLKQTVQQLLQQ